MRLIFLSACLLIGVNVLAQKVHYTDTLKNGDTTWIITKQPPMPGYDSIAGYSLNKYLTENLHYPNFALRNNILGRVIIKFSVNEDGSISDCAVTRHIDSGCDEEALRLIKNMPRWKPGNKNGKPAKVDYTIPVLFDSDRKVMIIQSYRQE